MGNALKGYFLCSRRVAREMVAQGQGGRAVSISSVHAFRAWPRDLVYAVCKAGLLRMAKSMAVDLSGHNITFNCIAPGYIGEAMEWIPSRRGGFPHDIARAVLFLSSKLGDYVNGECITVDGGFLAGGTPVY